MLVDKLNTFNTEILSRVSNVSIVNSGVCSTSLCSLYGIYGAICLQIQKYFPPDPAIFHQKININSTLYCIQIYAKYFNISWQNSKI